MAFQQCTMAVLGVDCKTKSDKMEPHHYFVDINWEVDRKGTLCSPEIIKNGGNCLSVATPPEFPKGIPGIWSPEHLFVAAVNACLMTTFLSIAENSKLEFISFTCQSKGKLDQTDGKMMMTEIILEPTPTIAYQKDHDRALRILQKSEAACLISNSVKSKITLIPTIKTNQ